MIQYNSFSTVYELTNGWQVELTMIIMPMVDGSTIYDYLFEIRGNNYQMVDVWDNANFINDFFYRIGKNEDVSDMLSEIVYFDMPFIMENRDNLLNLFDVFSSYKTLLCQNLK